MRPTLRAKAVWAYGLLPYRWRSSDRHFREWSARLATWERLTDDTARRMRFEAFRRVVTHAYGTTEFYRGLYDAAGFHPDQLEGPDDVESVPCISREDVRKQGSRMIVRGVKPGSLTRLSTSGTTGTPLSLFTDWRGIQREWASIVYQWGRVGYRLGDGRVEFRGVIASGVPYAVIPEERVLRINVHGLSESNLPEIVREIERSGYAFFQGYPSAIERFALLLERRPDVSLRPPRALLLSSESVHERQLEQLERVFPESRLFAHYGQAERVALGAWMPPRRAYYFLPAHGYIERDVASNQIIATGFGNEVMPLVRYRLTDIAEGYVDAPDPAAPGLFPVVEQIGGRLEDQLCRPDGDFVAPAVVTFPFKEGRTFAACRLVQHERDRLEVILEAVAPESEVRQEFETIRQRLAIVFGPTMRFELTVVEEIPRDPSGKFRWTENRVG